MIDKPIIIPVDPGYSEDVQEFQRVFRRYFPSIETDHEQACRETDWIFCRVLGNPKETVRRAGARRDLKRAVDALRLLSRLDMPYWQHLHWECNGYGSSDKDDPATLFQKAIFDFLLHTLGEMNEQGLTETVIAKFASDAELGILNLPETANINWEAVHAIDSLRILWWRNTGFHAPHSLNPASTFCDFLRDGFAYLEIEGDPVSAFRRWAARTIDPAQKI